MGTDPFFVLKNVVLRKVLGKKIKKIKKKFFHAQN
jgi:hypothetical protein